MKRPKPSDAERRLAVVFLGLTTGKARRQRNRDSNVAQPRTARTELPIPIPQTLSAFHPRAQRNAFRCRGVRLQSRSFARKNQSLKRSPSSNQLC
jgi:hypothetical protein